MNWFNIKNITCVILLILVLLFIPQIVGIFLLFYSAFVVTCSLEPLIQKLQKRFSRKTSATVAVFAFFGITLLTFIPIFVASINEIILFANSMPHNIDTATNL